MSNFARRDMPPTNHALWTGPELPAGAQMPMVLGARFELIKAYEPERDGYHWLKGVALVRHEDRWLASFGHNTCERGENNETELANFRVRNDADGTWSELYRLEDPESCATLSHGVFMKHDGGLWAFHGAFYGQGRGDGRVHTRAYKAEPGSVADGAPAWQCHGVAAWDGFWPLQEPVRMGNEQYIVGGVSVGGGDDRNTIPAIGLVHGEDLTQWEVVTLPFDETIWGECTVLVDGAEVVLIARSDSRILKALVARSNDCGKTWTPLEVSDLPMAASKPYAGRLSDGRPYLLNTICGDVVSTGRNPLCLLLGDPGGTTFNRAYRVIDSREPLPGAEPYATWAYPYAVEHDGELWIGFFMKEKGSPDESGAAGLVRVPVAAPGS